ncbi:type II secretion system F family protein [Paenibacillus yanchengensis]|uniref:Type II secretion system F family protein n=1 Tax=Paenibacillus yanchengensis TaxID=2035833 RepID=A0ABW4YFS1_9BACL
MLKRRLVKKLQVNEIKNWLALDIVSKQERIEWQRQATDYGHYRLSSLQWIGTAILGSIVIFILIYLFYRSIWLALLFSLLGIIAPRMYCKSMIKKRRQQLQIQFKEALYTITSSLAAGRSVENAFLTAVVDLSWLFPDPNTAIIKELQWVITRLQHAEPLEQALLQMAERTKVEEMMQFAEAIVTCKRSGGNLIEVTKHTAALISDKLATEQEIAVLIAHKKFEAQIMLVVPFVFLGFLQLAAPDYMAPLYSGIGYVVLTVALISIVISSIFILKIMNIKL